MSIFRRKEQEPPSQLLNALQGQIAVQRTYQHGLAQRTCSYLQCLVDRHDLPNFLADDQCLEGIPCEILQLLKNGKIPKTRDLAVLSQKDHALLIRELVWICGHGAIRWYREQGLSPLGNSWKLEEDL